jgi:transposase
MDYPHRDSSQHLMINARRQQVIDWRMKTSSMLVPTDHLDKLIEWLVPASEGLRMQQLLVASDGLTLVLASTRAEACCPLCGQATTRVHSRYQRTLQDLPWGHLHVCLRVQVHRFFCQNAGCARQIFTEPLPELAERYARRTNRLREALLALGWALGGQAGARQSAVHAMPICGATMLSLLRHWGTMVIPTPRVLGVDDWSFQARSPGTLLVDLERHRPVDVLLGSDEQVLASWLKTHPGVEVISRDRGVSYLKGANQGAPHAQQVLDRWHLLKNLGEVLQKILAQRVDVLHQAAPDTAPTSTASESLATRPPPPSTARSRKPPRRTPKPPSKQRQWQLAMYQQVHELAAKEWSKRAIARQLHLHPHTVLKYLRMEQFVDQRHNPHGSCLEPYRSYLQERWSQGCTMVKTLWEELCAQGFTGSYKSVCLFTRHWLRPAASPEALGGATAASQSPRTPWQTKWLLLRAPEELSARDASYCQALFHLCPAVAEAASLARRFGEMVRERKSDHLDAWLEQACGSPLPELRRFGLGVRAEYGAARAALTEAWSTGQVEGQITRLKYLKRQMYGRAKIDLLRLRVLHAA